MTIALTIVHGMDHAIMVELGFCMVAVDYVHDGALCTCGQWYARLKGGERHLS